MEAATYAAKWKLNIALPPTREDSSLPPGVIGSLYGIVLFHVDSTSNAWKEKNILQNAEISRPVLLTVLNRSQIIQIVVDHKQLRLTHKQFWAYEKWVRSVAENIRADIKSVIKRSSRLGSNYLSADVSCGVRMNFCTPVIEEGTESYRITSNIGDVVRMSCGTLAVVAGESYPCGGHCKLLTLRPICGIWRHAWLLVRSRLRSSDDQIDRLVKVGEIPLA